MFRLTKLLYGFKNLNVKKDALNICKSFFRHSSVTTWNKDWAPGPYPRTKEERALAAKKYNMLPEDYEPYPEEEGYGDYPKFPPTHMEFRNDFEVYDYPVLKRNYGEPIHPDFDICVEDKVNFQKEYHLKTWQMFAVIISFVAFYSFLIYFDEKHLPDLRQIPKQRPHRGEKSYTFEPAE